MGPSGKGKRNALIEIPQLKGFPPSTFSPFFETKMSLDSPLTEEAQIKRELTRRQVVLDEEKWKEVLEMVRESKAITHTAVQEVLNGYIMAKISLMISQEEDQECEVPINDQGDSRGTGWLHGFLKRRTSFRGLDSLNNDNKMDDFFENSSLPTQKYNKEDETISSAISRAFRRQISIDDDDSRASTIVRAFRRQKSMTKLNALPDSEASNSHGGKTMRNSFNSAPRVYKFTKESEPKYKKKVLKENELDQLSLSEHERIKNRLIEKEPTKNYNQFAVGVHQSKNSPKIIKPIPIRKAQLIDDYEEDIFEAPTISIAKMQKITGTEGKGSWAKMQKRMSAEPYQLEKIKAKFQKENVDNAAVEDNLKPRVEIIQRKDNKSSNTYSSHVGSTFSTVESIEMKKRAYVSKSSDLTEAQYTYNYSRGEFQGVDNETIGDGVQTVYSGKTESVFYDEGWRLRENDDTDDENHSHSETESERSDMVPSRSLPLGKEPSTFFEVTKSEQEARSRAFGNRLISESFDFADNYNVEDTLSISEASRKSNGSLSSTLRQKLSDSLSRNKVEEKLSEIRKGVTISSATVSPSEVGIGIHEQIKLEKKIDGKIAESIRRRLLASTDAKKKAGISNRNSITKQMRLSETSRRRNSLESTFRTPHKNEDISEWDKKISGGFFPTEAIDELFTGKNSNIKESKFRRSLGPAVFVEDRKKKNPQFPRRSSEGFPTSRKVPNPMQKVSFDPVMKDKARSVELQRSIKSDLKFRNSLGPATVVREKKKKHPRRRSEGLQSLRKSLDPSRVSFDFASVNEKFGKIGEGSFLQNSNHRKSTDTRNSSSIIKKLELLSDPEKQFEKDSSDNRINLMALASLEDAYENASDDESMSTYSYAHAMETRGNSTRLKQSLFQNQNSDDDIQNSRTEKLNVTEYLNQMGKYKKR